MQRMIKWLWIVSCLVVTAGCGRGAPALPGTAEGEEILSRVAEFYQRQAGFRVSSQLEAVLQDRSGRPLPSYAPLHEQRFTAVQLPNRFAFHGGEFRIASDGQWLRLSPNESDMYWRMAAPQRLGELTDLIIAPLFGGAENMRLLRILDEGAEAALRRQGEVVQHVGRVVIGDRSAHHLRIQQPAGDPGNPQHVMVTEVWVAADGDPVLLQVRTTSPPRQLHFETRTIEASVLATETFADWEFGDEGSGEAFTLENANRRVGSLAHVLTGDPPMLGELAPEIELSLLEGGSTSLAELRGSKIVLLDFWATWCGPCREELPMLLRLADEFASQGVVLYAVNIREPPTAIRSFLESQPLALTVALDESGTISHAFGVGSIPHLTILGRDGTIQAVHVGMGPDTEAALREELQALLSGRNVASEGLPE